VFSLIDNPKANLSFFAFFEPSTRFKNPQGLLSFIRLASKFVVLNRENGNAPVFFSAKFERRSDFIDLN
jgi:hypothetical protein